MDWIGKEPPHPENKMPPMEADLGGDNAGGPNAASGSFLWYQSPFSPQM